MDLPHLPLPSGLIHYTYIIATEEDARYELIAGHVIKGLHLGSLEELAGKNTKEEAIRVELSQ
jgi:hypothetical protein